MKRASEKGDGKGRAPKQARTGKFGQHAFKVLCPDPLVAVIMGDRGAGVRDIEARTGTHMQFSPRGEYFPETKLRVLVIYAKEPHCIFEALEALLDGIEGRAYDERRENLEEFVDSEGRLIFKCTLSKPTTGAIIGTKGESIRALRDTTGARVDIQREAVDGHQLATILGSRQQLLDVLNVFNDTVQNDVDQAWFPAWADQTSIGGHGDGGGHSRSGKGDRDSGKGDRDHDAPPRGRREDDRRGDRGGGGSGPPPHEERDSEHKDSTIFIGRLAQTTDTKGLERHFARFGTVIDADVRIDQGTGRSKGFGFITFTRPSMVDDCLAAREHMLDGRKVDVKRYGEDRGGRADRDGGMDDIEPVRSKGNSKGGSKGDGRHHAEDNGNAAEPIGLEAFADYASTVPPEYFGMEYCISFSLPSAKCGALIGKRGDNVGAVERETQAKVVVDKEHIKGQDGQEPHRKVTITGALLSVYAAHMRLMQNYNDAEEKYQASKSGGEAGDTVEDLKRQVALLSEKLNAVSSPGTSKGKGKSKGGKGARR